MSSDESTGSGRAKSSSLVESISTRTIKTTRSLLDHSSQHERSHKYTSTTGTGTTTTTAATATTKLINRRERLKNIIVISLFLIGLLICITSLICIILLPRFVSHQISERLVLKNNSLLLERWSKPNVPMYFKVWVFNVKNAQSIVDQRNIKPELEEIGPFVFHLKRQKDVISIAGENLYYTERKVYHFAPELSCCAINTTVTIPNIPLAAVVDRALSYNLPLVGRFIPRLINRAIQSLREQLFVRKQVREILFDGYEVELLKMVSRVGSLIGLQPQMSQKFALLKGRNDTWRPEQDGVWAINTGSRDRRQFGRVTSWNSYKQLPFWAAPNCNLINGSDGTLFPPPIRKTEPLYIFNQELCRTVNLVYDRPSDIRSIKALRYVLNPLNFAHTMKGSTSTNGAPSGALSRATSVLTRMQPQVAQPALVQRTTSAPIPLPLPATNQSMDLLLSLLNNAAEQQQQQQQQQPPQPSPQSPAARTTNGHQIQRAATGELQSSGSTAGATTTRLAQERHIQLAQDANAASKRTRMNPNTCFCDRKSTNLNGINVCEFDGLIDLSKCTKQAQVIFGSMPHFYQSDARLLRQVTGLAPNASKHTTYLDIEPNTGLVLGGKRRVQLNLILKHNNDIDGFENINDMLIPVVWFEESALIPEESAKKFRTLFTERIRLINFTLVSLLLASLVLLIIDTRLIIASKYWRRFKVSSIMAQFAAADNFRSTSNSAQVITRGGSSDSSTGSTMLSASKKSHLIGRHEPKRSRSELSTGSCVVEQADGSSLDLLSNGPTALGSSPPAAITTKKPRNRQVLPVGKSNSELDRRQQQQQHVGDRWSRILQGCAIEPVESEATDAVVVRANVQQVNDNRSVVSISHSNETDFAGANGNNDATSTSVSRTPIGSANNNNNNNNAKQVRSGTDGKSIIDIGDT